MVASRYMSDKLSILCVIGPTASGKSSRAVEEALNRNGEVISVDSRQVYRMLDIGTEKVTPEEMQGVPHHLIDILDPRETYSAGDFAADAHRLVKEIHDRGKLPVLAGGTHFYFDALLYGLPEISINPAYRESLETFPTDELFLMLKERDPKRSEGVDPRNRRRLIRALEIVEKHGTVPPRSKTEPAYDVEWIVLNPERDVLRERIIKRLESAFDRGLVEEVRRVREYVGDVRLNELGLEYRVIGEYLRGERDEASLKPRLSSKLWQYARHQKAWLKRFSA